MVIFSQKVLEFYKSIAFMNIDYYSDLKQN